MCSLFGIVAPDLPVADLTYLALYALQHRGQEGAGISVSNHGQIQTYKQLGLVPQVFTETVLRQQLIGQMAIGHTRYSTTGSGHVVENLQPLEFSLDGMPFTVAHNGNLVNQFELHSELTERGYRFKTSSDTEIVGALIAQFSGLSFEEAIFAATRKIKGAYSLVFLTPDRVLGMRDPYGIRPLLLGKMGNHYMLASESPAFDIVGGKLIRDIEPGELVSITDVGVETKMYEAQTKRRMCVFEYIYLARPDGDLYGRNVYKARRRMGEQLALEHPVKADVVIGVPDSGTPAALGYAKASGIEYEEGLIKNRYVGRTFINPDPMVRDLGVKIKLHPIREVIEGKRVVVVDDSIVRGTTSRKIVSLLKQTGAAEVHMRVSSPPIVSPCFYGIDTASYDELIGARKTPAEIARYLGADSLGYLSIEGMVKAIRLSDDQFCMACLNGKYPIEVPASMKREKNLLTEPAPPAVA